MARVLTSGFTQLITPGLAKVYFDTLAGVPKEFRQWANVRGPEAGGAAGRNFLEELQVASLGTMAQKQEGVAVQYDIPVEGNKVRATPFTFGLGYRITMEAQQDELYGVFAKMTRELAMSADHQMEVQAHRILNGGFTSAGGGTGYTAAGYDTLSLFNTAHTLLRGGNGFTTRPNRAATDLDLSVTALEQAFDIFETWVNHSGMPRPTKASLLIVPPQLKWIARELTESELKPYTGNNEVNPLGGEGLQFMVDHYLTDSDSWYLLGAKSDHDLQVWMRMTPTIQTGDDFDTGDTKVKGVFRMAEWHGEPDGTFGSQGA